MKTHVTGVTMWGTPKCMHTIVVFTWQEIPNYYASIPVRQPTEFKENCLYDNNYGIFITPQNLVVKEGQISLQLIYD